MLLLQISIAFAVCLIVAGLFIKSKKLDLENAEVVDSLNEVQRNFFNMGYVFVDLWSVKDLHRIAKDLGYAFNRHEIVQIITSIQEEFNTCTGISESVIKAYMRAFVKQFKKDHETNRTSLPAR